MPAQVITQDESKLINDTLFEQLSSRDAALEKRAVDAVNDFTRTKMREDGFYRRILPPLTITNDQLDRSVSDDRPIKIVDKEPDSPAAVSIPFATLPSNLYIKGPRYQVNFDRIVTPRFTKDVDELRTWIMDIRQVLSDNAIKDMLAEEDGKFLYAVNTSLLGPGLTMPTSGTVQWEQIAGGITRDTWNDAMKVVPNTPSSIEVHTVLINHITIKDLQKWGRDEMGGDMSQDIMRQGWTLTEFDGKQLIITIKKNLVPTGSIYMFGDPKFIGKSYLLEDTTLYIKRESYLLEFFAYETLGGSLGHSSAYGRVDFI